LVTETRHTISRHRFLRTTLSQLLVASIVVPTAFYLVGASGAVSVLSGAACSVLPQAFFALRMERAARTGPARAARLGMAAEAGKFMLSAAAFAVVFAVIRPSNPGLVFAGFGVMWVVQIIESARLLRVPQGRQQATAVDVVDVVDAVDAVDAVDVEKASRVLGPAKKRRGKETG
jgi:ATP synthase protein I